MKAKFMNIPACIGDDRLASSDVIEEKINSAIQKLEENGCTIKFATHATMEDHNHFLTIFYENKPEPKN